MALELERYQDAIPHYYLTLEELNYFPGSGYFQAPDTPLLSYKLRAVSYAFHILRYSSPLYWGCQPYLKIIIKNTDYIIYRRFIHDFDVYGLDITGHQQIVRKLSLLSNLRHLRLRNLNVNEMVYNALTELVLVNCSGVSMKIIAKIGTLRTLIIRNIKITLKYLPLNLDTLIVTNAGLRRLKGIEKVVMLEKVIVANNPLRRIRGIDKLVHLKYLDLSWTLVSDISSLITLKKLRYLNISDTRVVDYNWVRWSGLKILYVRYPYRMRIR
jgi:hypothetical protein